jgi:hypothetical protein
MGFFGSRDSLRAGRWELLPTMERISASLEFDPDVVCAEKNRDGVDIPSLKSLIRKTLSVAPPGYRSPQ